MDFGGNVISLVSSSSDTTPTSTTTVFASDLEAKHKWYRSDNAGPDIECLKVAKNSDDFSLSKAMLMKNNHNNSINIGSPLMRSASNSTTSLFSDGLHQQQMLSFSSPKSQPLSLPYYHHTSTPYSRNTGYGSGGLNAANMHGIISGVRGPFTPSQWMELEHQALIYKYITANSPVPSNLLNPIRKALESAGFSTFTGAHLRSNTLGWGAFHLGYSNNSDPEPGRCRRTDGKKWRCSRDAVPDQKYCERHVNRGRHRSRKPVEGQTGHSVSGTTNTTTAKFLPVSSSTSAASVVPASGTSNSLGLSNHQINSLHHGAPNPSTAPHINRSLLNNANVGGNVQDTTGLSMLSPTIGLKDNQFPTRKQQNPYQESSRAEFGLVCSDSLLNPFQKSSSLINCRRYASSEDINSHENKSQQHSLRQFMDDWPKNQSERSALSWPDVDMQSDRTQLSISIPMAASDFMSSTSSPTNGKLALSPLRLSRELDSTQMGLGMNGIISETNQRQAGWIPITWENSMGGPLGEVLHSTNNNAGDCSNTSGLNLMTEGWNSSPRLASSPTGVLQKTMFHSLSNSSAGSSPRTENNLLGANLISSSLPAL